jgi:hypothetical protein
LEKKRVDPVFDLSPLVPLPVVALIGSHLPKDMATTTAITAGIMCFPELSQKYL